jgi:hypothetical protein
MKQAEQGQIDDEAHARNIAPGLPDAFYKMAANQSAAVRPAVEQNWNKAVRAAALLNAYDHATTVLPKDSQGNPILKDSSTWFGRPLTTNEMNPDQRQLHDAILLRRELDSSGQIPVLKKSNLIMPDETGTWHPAVPQPRSMQLPPPGSGGPGPGASLTPGSGASPPGPSARTNTMSLASPVAPGTEPDTNIVPSMPQQPYYHPMVFNRARELMSIPGMDPTNAWNRAKGEFQMNQLQ